MNENTAWDEHGDDHENV